MSFAACGFESHWAHWLISLVGVGLLIIEDYVSVAELADALDLGSSAFGRVGSTPTGRTSGRGFRSFLLPLASRSCYDGWDAVRRIGSIGRATAL